MTAHPTTTDRDAEVKDTLTDLAAAVERARTVESELREATRQVREERRRA